MSNIILANLESPLLDALNKTNKTDIAYTLQENFPNLAINKYTLSPNPVGATTGLDISGSTITFQLPRNGILCNLTVESTIVNGLVLNTPAITGDATHQQPSYLGLSLFSRIDLLSNNVILATQSDSYLRVRTETADLVKALRVKKITRAFSTDKYTLASAWATTVAIVTYTPVYFSLFERVESMLDLSFVQNLVLQLTVNTFANMGLAGSLTSITPLLHAKYFTLGANDTLALRARNYGSGNPYLALGYSTYTETAQLADGLTTVNLYPQCQNAVFRTHIYLKNRNTNMQLAIKNLTVSMAGVNIMNNIPTVVMQYEQEFWQGGGLLSFDQYQTSLLTGGTVTNPIVYMGRGDNEPVSIYWGLQPDRTYNSGAVSYHNITNLTFTLTTAATSTTDYYIVHEFYQMLAVNASSGDVSVSASS